MTTASGESLYGDKITRPFRVEAYQRKGNRWAYLRRQGKKAVRDDPPVSAEENQFLFSHNLISPGHFSGSPPPLFDPFYYCSAGRLVIPCFKVIVEVINCPLFS